MEQKEAQEDVLRGRILNIALGTRLQVQLAGMDGHFRSSMVGMQPDQFLLIQLPMITGILNKLQEGNRATVRYLYSGSVYGFHSTVLHFITKPTPLLFLTYPRTIEILQLRQAKRVDCFFAGSARIQGKEYQGAVVDISTGGCKFFIDTSGDVTVTQMAVGERMEVSFQLPGNSEPQNALGKVRSTSRDPMKVIVGIQFDALGAEVVNSIEALIGSFWLSDDHHPSHG